MGTDPAGQLPNPVMLGENDFRRPSFDFKLVKIGVTDFEKTYRMRENVIFDKIFL